MKAKALQYRHSAVIGLFIASMGSAGHPIGIEELLREPVKTETRARVSKEACSRAAPRTATPTKARSTTVAKADKGLKLFRWLL